MGTYFFILPQVGPFYGLEAMFCDGEQPRAAKIPQPAGG